MELVLLYLILALSVSFLCSVMEAVLLSTPMSFITMKEQAGFKSASLLKKLKQDIDKPIAAILSLNTIAHTVGAAGVGAEAVKVFGEAYFGVISAVLTVLILVLSEIIPKSVGANYWRSLAVPSARIIRTMIIVSYPLVWLSELITKLVSPSKHEASVSREEVSAMVSIGAEEGVFENKENRMIQNLIKLDGVKAKDVMTPRVVVASAPEDMTMREFYQSKDFCNYSRIPVYSKDEDNITGYVLRQAILERLAEDKFDMHLSDILRPILAYQESTPVSTIWEQMLEKKEHISIIVDEYGALRGIVTMEDIIETALGFEIVDERDAVTDMQKLARERWQKRRALNEKQLAGK
ncbi:CNNM domain-containing protein [Mediterranea massiliensis]|uniref:CNNM domain-containing protein n=1 Tax=Mediterranea massiliensis TaxID=1841865 RepID=UPI0025A42231|nr:hemolysin family protein [Mediterranea massiliensis]MDM8339060.1 hemolysin family protein [Mediterranea massiliensis]